MRKKKLYTINEKGRDQGKSFLLTEMSCDRAEKWALRAIAGAARAGVDVSDLPAGGMAGMAVLGIQAMLQMPFADLEPLIDEMFVSVKIVRDKKYPDVGYDLLEDDIEEIQTRMLLRTEVLQLHVDFFPDAKTPPSTSETPEPSVAFSNTPTSRPSSGQRSRITRPR